MFVTWGGKRGSGEIIPETTRELRRGEGKKQNNLRKGAGREGGREGEIRLEEGTGETECKEGN